MKTFVFIYYLFYAMWTVEADVSAEGFEGGEVSFRCSHQYAQSNNKYLCKNSCGSREDILLSVIPGGRSVSERIALKDWGNGVFTVTFSGLQLTDSGTYWCGVERMGLDTFTAIHLTVKEGVASKTTTGPPDSSPTWTDINDHTSRQQTLKTDADTPMGITTAPNSTTGGGQSNSTGTVLLASLPATVVCAMVLVAWLWKRRKSSKSRPQGCTNSTAVVCVDNREQVDCECSSVRMEMQEEITSPDNQFCTREPAQDPPTAVITAAECSDPLQIYENICCFRDGAHGATNSREEDNTCSGIYINPLPSTTSEHKGPLRKKAKKHMSARDMTGNPTDSSGGKVSETRPGSLWFGLDLSGTI